MRMRHPQRAAPQVRGDRTGAARAARILWLLAIGLVFALGNNGSVGAQQGGVDPLYVIADLPVDVRAASAQAAREQALAEGQLSAWRRLVERLVHPDDQALVPTGDPALVESLILDLAIANERRSDVRYLADLTFRFRSEAVRQVFADAAVRFTETASPPILILPVIDPADGSAPRLFEDPNPWAEAWARLDPSSPLVPLIVPLGDVLDLTQLPARTALARDAQAFARARARYGAGAVAVVLARAIPGSPPRLELALVVDRADRPSAEPVTFTLTGEAGQPAAAPPDAIEGEAPAMPDPELWARAVDQVVASIRSDWKRESAVGARAAGELRISAPIAGLDDWVRLRRQLTGTAGVQSIEVVMLRRASVIFDLIFAGDADRLRRSLAQYGLGLEAAGLGMGPDISGTGAGAPPPYRLLRDGPGGAPG